MLFQNSYTRMIMQNRARVSIAFGVMLMVSRTMAADKAPPSRVRYSEHLADDHRTYASGRSAVDLDGDDLDLISADIRESTVWSCAVAMLTRAVPDSHAARGPGGPYKIVAADFTGDKIIDIALAYAHIGLVTVEQGDGRGQFSHIGSVEVSVAEPSEVRGVYNLACGDIDRDGLLDLAVTVHGTPPDNWRTTEISPTMLRSAWSGRVVLVRNCGQGRMQKVVEYSTDSQAVGVRLAHLDHDGRLDLLYTARGSGYPGDVSFGKLLIRQGFGDWRFGHAIECEAGPSAYFVETADLNNDGFLDVLVPNEHANTVTYFINPGKEVFAIRQSPSARVVRAGMLMEGESTANVNNVRAADFNGDGNMDLVTANLGPSTISVFPGNGNGTFQKDSLLEGGQDGAFLAVGDLDSDGDFDFLVTHWTGDFLSVFLNHGRGTFAPRRDYPTALGNYGVTLCDVDHDGKLDAVTANYRDRSISLLKGVGDGTFQPAVTTRKGLSLKDGKWVSEGLDR